MVLLEFSKLFDFGSRSMPATRHHSSPASVHSGGYLDKRLQAAAASPNLTLCLLAERTTARLWDAAPVLVFTVRVSGRSDAGSILCR
jgi:hypothetical protein